MKAIILAAGRGSRMKRLTDDLPKCLVTLRGQPLLDLQIKALKEAGITDIAIVTGYKREMLSSRDLVEFHNPNWSSTNMVSSLACAETWLNSEPCIVSYSDIFYDKTAVTSLMNITKDLAITYDPNWLSLWKQRFEDPLDDAETFKLDNTSHLVEIGNRPQSIEEVEGQYMGLLRFTPKAWQEVKRIRSGLSKMECDSMHMTETLQKVIEHKNINIGAVAYKSEWGEVDSEEDLKSYH